ncbi:hypothetical protein SAMN05421805_10658 [Saccharopolyspora antimicrobica]|uniref:Uncharacterized protein n=1 Tax=Saccharopolyspora antimicrobica TaxID=455193 RepID=A0A1I5AZ97_9PSEU|nr:hypothetical protein [Saccharopolyspora antimicrobica]RKT86417.1 hypothetical protein ATL45_4784 [Saccharopolyspora antimicrobica]SFN67788.1 hypothetical protein SAMN05421805_10658 [Saccharopolyspora antimicrobica]
MAQPDKVPDAVVQLRSARAKLDSIKTELKEARDEQAQLETKINDLLAQQREARKERNDAVLAADAAKIPRLTISKEVGMQRSNVYKLLDSGNTSDS